MPEYKRFIAYFYEYIDGRKQKNAGFAKVELRNGMWRILFRIRTDQMPETPVQVFGFVRERGYLLGFLLGNMGSGYEIAEEWAYGADKEIGYETYRFGDLSGIWIQSGDGRKFITVWDDDPVDVQKFVIKVPEEKRESEKEKEKEKAEDTETSERIAGKDLEDIEHEDIEHEDIKCKDTEEKEMEIISAEKTELIYEEAENKKETQTVKIQENIRTVDASCLETLFSKRKHIQPFAQWHLSDCIQIMPCDLMRLQQEGWQPGRSSFLQHGFYQYHHLLLGKNADGDYIIGVPGIRNTQEQYMAQLFGYDKFLRASVYDCGKVFGYWCRTLQNQQRVHT